MANTKKNMSRKRNKKILVIVGAMVVILAFVLVIKGAWSSTDSNITSDGSLIIPKIDITATAKFFPYNVGGTKMEVLAVKASDGTIRTAFNTCQVCYGSGRGYYKLDGDILVCQNCGNRFEPDQVEMQKGGCNPVPIFDEDKSDDGQNIVITKDYFQQAKEIFSNWKN